MTLINLIFLTADRFVHTVLPMSYSVAAEEKGIFKKLIIGAWVFLVLFCFLVLKKVSIVVRFTLGLNIFGVVTFVVMYIFIIAKIRQFRRAVMAQGSVAQGGPTRISVRKHHLVPGLIIITFTLFYVIP